MDNDTLDQFLVNYSPENVYDFATNGDINNLILALNVEDNSTRWFWGHVDDADAELFVALHRAAENGHIDCVEALLNCGADISSRTSWCGKSPMHLAAKKGHLSIVEMLIERGADINMETKYYDPEGDCFGKAIAAAAYSNHEDIVEMLYDKGSAGLEDALNAAASNGSLNCMDFLLDVGIDVNSKDRQDYTPLNAAAIYDEPDSAELLIMRGANVNLMTKYNNLMLAAQNGCIDMCRLLLDNKADIDNNICIYSKRPNFPGYDCIPMILEEIENRRKRAAFDSFVAHHIEYPPYKNRISICYPDGNIQIAEPHIDWPRAVALCEKYYFEEIFFYLHLHVAKTTTNSTSDRYSSIIALARDSDATSTLMTVLVDRLKMYLKPAAL